MAQLATLLGTSLIGLSIALTPQPGHDPKLSQLEQTMGVDLWAYLMMFLGLAGFCAEVYMKIKKNEKFFWLVSMCHILLLSLMLAYSAAATVGIINHGTWWTFSVPVVGLMIATWHFAYVQRKPNKPIGVLNDW